jgi:hypothetical protein
MHHVAASNLGLLLGGDLMVTVHEVCNLNFPPVPRFNPEPPFVVLGSGIFW